MRLAKLMFVMAWVQVVIAKLAGSVFRNAIVVVCHLGLCWLPPAIL